MYHKNENKQIEFGYSAGIAGYGERKEVNNHLLQAVGKFSEAVLIQANKIPQIAAVLEKRDVEQAQRWES